jgi:ABC-type sugar transport system permease subunit
LLHLFLGVLLWLLGIVVIFFLAGLLNEGSHGWNLKEVLFLLFVVAMDGVVVLKDQAPEF